MLEEADEVPRAIYEGHTITFGSNIHTDGGRGTGFQDILEEVPQGLHIAFHSIERTVHDTSSCFIMYDRNGQ